MLDDNLLAGVIASSRRPPASASWARPWAPSPSPCCSARTTRLSRPAAVDGVLTKLMQSGEVEKIYNKWFVERSAKNVSLNLPG